MFSGLANFSIYTLIAWLLKNWHAYNLFRNENLLFFNQSNKYFTNKNVRNKNPYFLPSVFHRVNQETLESNILLEVVWNLKCAKRQSLRQWESLEQKVSKIYYSNISNKWNLEAFWKNDFHLHVKELSELNACQGSRSNIWNGTL